MTPKEKDDKRLKKKGRFPVRSLLLRLLRCTAMTKTSPAEMI
jgi:hypothetical protein